MFVAALEWKIKYMADLFQCTRCNSPFVAGDEEHVGRRGGTCPECAKVEILKSMGLPADFLNRSPFQ
jgi:DNA-directed RNA polymerase subunit RPC12/RpoP